MWAFWYKLWSYHPPVGVFIAMLAVLGVLVPMIREKVGRREKAVWTVVMFVLLLLELKSIYQDRNEHEQEQANARNLELQNFDKVGNGITEAIRQNQQNFNSVMANTDTLLKANLGGDSFCFMLFEPGLLEWKGQAVPEFAHKGKYPLYDVNVLIIDDVKAEKLTGKLEKGKGVILAGIMPAEATISVGDMPAGSSNILWNKPISLDNDPMSLTMMFTARNGSWQEQMKATKVNGKWMQAIVVYRMTRGGVRQVLHEDVSKGFPRGSDGKVDWGWSRN